MYTLQLLIIAILFSTLTACASSGQSTASVEESPQFVNVRVVDGPVQYSAYDADGNAQDFICKRERMLGSRFSRMVCKTRQDIEREQRLAEQSMRQIHQKNAADFFRR